MFSRINKHFWWRAGHAALAFAVLLATMLLSPDSAEPNTDTDQNRGIQTQSPPTVQPAEVLSGEEEELLARLVRAEAQGEPYAGKVAVAAVVLNRLEHPEFPDTVNEIVFQPSQFEPVLNGTINQPAGAADRNAVRDAKEGWDPSSGAIYFFNPTKTPNAFVWSRPPIKMIGSHRFTN